MFGGIDDIFGNMDRMMNNMMNGMGMMGSPFGGLMGPLGPMGNNQMNNPMSNPMSNPMNQMQLMNNRMNNQLAMFGNLGWPSNMTSFSMASMPGQSVSYSSKVMTFSNDGTGRPQVYEQTSSQVCGPGGVRETKETVRDSRTGLQQIKLGRHINDRGHLKAKKRNVYNGEESEEEELINLDEEEVEQFSNEFNQKTKDFRQKYQSIQSHPANHTGGRQRLALTNGPSASSHHHRVNNISQQHQQQQQPCTSQQVYNLQHEDTRPPSRGKKVKDAADKKSKKKSKKPY